MSRIDSLAGWRLQIALMLAGVSMAFAGLADGVPPPTDPWSELPSATLKLKPVSELRLGRLKLKLETSTLREAIGMLGDSAIEHFEDADASFDWACYDTLDRQRLWLISDTDSGGPQHALTGVVAIIRGDDNDGACPPLPRKLGALSIDRDLWLGARDGELTRTLGEPSAVRRDWLSFYSNHRIKLPRKTPNEDGEMFDDVSESSYLNVRIADGRVVQLVAGKLTSD